MMDARYYNGAPEQDPDTPPPCGLAVRVGEGLRLCYASATCPECERCPLHCECGDPEEA